VNKKLSNVLLIDDNEDDNWYHKFVLEGTGIATEIHVINDSRKALEWWKTGYSSRQQFPELVFVDINMPAYNGFELLDRIRQLHDPDNVLKKVKIFMLTGSINPDDYKRATTEYKDIILGFHLKPLSEKTIREILDKHF
jgi:CheY-like chemotaxis protein